MVNSEVIELVEGMLYQLPNPFELNGFVASHPLDARGWAPLNCYLLTDGRRALLIDTGFSTQEASVVEQLGSLIDLSMPLEMFFTSLGEYASMSNVRPITEAFNVTKYYGLVATTYTWMDFRPEYSPFGSRVGDGKMSLVETGIVSSTDTIDWAHDKGRVLELLSPPVRLLPTHWAYDTGTGALFTNDAFSDVWRETSAGPWTLTSQDSLPGVDEVYATLTRGGRYWWLPGADVLPLKKAMTEVFERYEVKIIAPKFGCSITDPDAIRDAYELWLAVLDRAGEDRPPDPHAGIGKIGAVRA